MSYVFSVQAASKFQGAVVAVAGRDWVGLGATLGANSADSSVRLPARGRYCTLIHKDLQSQSKKASE